MAKTTEHHVELPMKYPYRARLWTMLGAFVLFGGCLGYFVYLAMSNEQGLILNGFIEFSIFGATVFYWILGACCFGFVFIAAASLVHRYTSNEFLEIDEQSLVIPRSLFKKGSDRVLISNIDQLHLHEAAGQQFLQIYSLGKKYSINAGMLPTNHDFDLVLATVTALNENKNSEDY